MNRYTFKIILCGNGETAEEAWNDATESFCLDPGLPEPEFTEVEPFDENDEIDE